MIVKGGYGTIVLNGTIYADGINIPTYTVSLDTATKIPLNKIDTMYAEPGSILMIDEYGELVCKKMNDNELREQYPSVNQAWQNVLLALAEYELSKKLVKDFE